MTNFIHGFYLNIFTGITQSILFCVTRGVTRMVAWSEETKASALVRESDLKDLSLLPRPSYGASGDIISSITRNSSYVKSYSPLYFVQQQRGNHTAWWAWFFFCFVLFCFCFFVSKKSMMNMATWSEDWRVERWSLSQRKCPGWPDICPSCKTKWV